MILNHLGSRKTKRFLKAALFVVAFLVPILIKNQGIAAEPFKLDAASTNSTLTPAKPHPKPKTFHGKLTAIDKAAETVTVAGWRKHVLMVTESTKLTRDDKPVAFGDLTIGEHLVGQYFRAEDGKNVAVALHFKKAKVEKTEGEESPKPAESEPKK